MLLGYNEGEKRIPTCMFESSPYSSVYFPPCDPQYLKTFPHCWVRDQLISDLLKFSLGFTMIIIGIVSGE